MAVYAQAAKRHDIAAPYSHKQNPLAWNLGVTQGPSHDHHPRMIVITYLHPKVTELVGFTTS